MTIHEVIEATGFNRRTIYYYTQLGLLPPPRGKGKHYEYTEEHVQRLQKIRHLQRLRYSLKEIKALLEQERDEERTVLMHPLLESADRISSAVRDEVEFAPRSAQTVPGEPWRRWVLAPGVELHFRWPLPARTLELLENQWSSIFTRLKEGQKNE